MTKGLFLEGAKAERHAPDCLVCRQAANALFTATVLEKYDVAYFKCPQCGFIQTESPYWLDEAYESPIASLDVGLVRRNLDTAELAQKVINKSFDPAGKFLDYAGGYGLFVRLMRDKGYDFVRQDRFCKNIFATHHDLCDLPFPSKFELVTAFEVLEHLGDPHEEVKRMLEFSDSILFTTEIVPHDEIARPDDWWYFGPESGQHISFYSLRSLEILAEKSNCYFWTNRQNTHLFTRRRLKVDPLQVDKRTVSSLLAKAITKLNAEGSPRMKSLIEADFELARQKLTREKHPV